MYCSNCGAQLKETDAKCPYCGTINAIGAEAEYMDKLEDIREETEDLAELPPEEYSQHLKHHGKFALKIALGVAVLCLTIFLIFLGVSHFRNSREKMHLQEQLAFEKKFFPVLDELYAAGDDRKVYEYLITLYEEEGSDALFSWEHEEYFYYYGHYLEVTRLKKLLEDKSYTEDDLNYGFYCALQLAMEEVQEFGRRQMSEEDLQKIASFQEESIKFLNEAFQLTVQEVNEAYEACCDDGYLSYELCKKYLKDKILINK
ncbi:MAG: zinc ribbon domain-containing protein [Clostridiales bacterium]|nr:zinc ribbon domain-containing protein [Clostridiales bacterium]